MQIISHRGYWQDPAEKNTSRAFHRSFAHGFGLETDVRDSLGKLVIAHDLPAGEELTFSEFLAIYKNYDTALPLAINVKADGLQALLQAELAQYQVDNYFVFDMSVPDGLVYLRHQLKAFTRQSEFENLPLSFYEHAEGVWVDCFKSDWIDHITIQQHLANQKKVCLVSPELHKREHLAAWHTFKQAEWASDPRVMLCTDYPTEAKVFFNA